MTKLGNLYYQISSLPYYKPAINTVVFYKNIKRKNSEIDKNEHKIFFSFFFNKSTTAVRWEKV